MISLKEGQNLSIYFQKESNIVEMACTIAEVFDDRITINLPKYFMRYIEYLDVGSPLTVKVFTKIGTIDFNTIVIVAPLEGDFAIEIDYNAMKFVPKEQMPPIEAIEPLKITIDDRVIKATTLAISTEYLKFSSTYDFKVGDVIECELLLPYGCGIIKFNGNITYIDEIYYDEIKLVYSNMIEKDRQTLIQYMYMYSTNNF